MKGSQAILVTCLAILLVSFSKDESSFKATTLEQSLVLVPGRGYHYGMSDKPIQFEVTVPGQSVEVDSFYICKYEVSNKMYRLFMNELARTDAALSGKMLPDTLVWRDPHAYNEPYVLYYFRHPAYDAYPVVGITYEQAAYFCTWLTAKYMAQPKRKYKNVLFKLPTRYEWTLAALGKGQGDRPLMDSQGKWTANFRVIRQEDVGRETAGEESDKKTRFVANYANYSTANGADITTPVKSYAPNSLGIFNMAGNVEELVEEKGISKGGSWNDPGYYLQSRMEEKYDSHTATSSSRGFRFAMKIVR